MAKRVLAGSVSTAVPPGFLDSEDEPKRHTTGNSRCRHPAHARAHAHTHTHACTSVHTDAHIKPHPLHAVCHPLVPAALLQVSLLPLSDTFQYLSQDLWLWNKRAQPPPRDPGLASLMVKGKASLTVLTVQKRLSTL